MKKMDKVNDKFMFEGKLFVLREVDNDKEDHIAIEVGSIDLYDLLERLNRERVRISIEVIK